MQSSDNVKTSPVRSPKADTEDMPASYLEIR